MTAPPSLLRRAESVMRALAAACLMGMALVTGADVFMRGLFNAPIFGSEEIVGFLGVVVVGFSLPYTHYQRSHIGVEIFVRRFRRRTRRIFKLITDTLTLALMAVITWRMFLYAKAEGESGAVSMNLELPEYMVVYVLAFGFLVYSGCIVVDALKFFTKQGNEA